MSECFFKKSIFLEDVNKIQTEFPQSEIHRRFEELYFGGGLDGKVVVKFSRGFKVFGDSNYEFYFMALILTYNLRVN